MRGRNVHNLQPDFLFTADSGEDPENQISFMPWLRTTTTNWLNNATAKWKSGRSRAGHYHLESRSPSANWGAKGLRYLRLDPGSFRAPGVRFKTNGAIINLFSPTNLPVE